MTKKDYSALSPLNDRFNLRDSYDHYFRSGNYKNRYPRVNSNTLGFINHFLSGQPVNFHLLDFGCGTGRYLMQVLHNYPQAQITAHDISTESLRILNDTLTRERLSERVAITSRFPQQRLRGQKGSETKPFQLIMLMFGVLAHITNGMERATLLKQLHSQLESQTGILLLSVPNQRRRFRTLQRQQNSTDIHYSRNLGEQATHFEYHLYSVAGIEAELSRHGFEVVRVKAESLLPENWVTQWRLIGWLDRQLCQWLPARWGYGILVACRKVADEGRA